MPYAEGRVMHDADSHIMETPGLLGAFADPGIRDRLATFPAEELVGGVGGGAGDYFADRRKEHNDADFRRLDEAEIMLRKNWQATGSFIKEDRGRALDLLGFQSQLVFNTFWSAYLNRLEHEGDLELAYGAARAHNRAMLDFCAADRRLMSTCYVPLMDFDRAREMAEEVIALGTSAILIPSACPEDHAPSHIGLFPLWARAEEAGIPVVMHVGGGGRLLDPTYFKNGLPEVRDFHGGAENFRSVDYMAIPGPPAQTLSTLIIDGVLETFPGLRIGIVEQGSLWLPGLMRMLDSALEAFGRHEERLQKLTLKPSDYIRRQVRITPYPTEDIGWVIEQAGPEVCMFASDYPHVEGGRHPIRRFENSIADLSDGQKQRFYCENFIDLMGAGSADILRPGPEGENR